jgi:predicted small secreted protein
MLVGAILIFPLVNDVQWILGLVLYFTMFIIILAALLILTGCNTVAGMGSDITKSAEWTRDKMSGSKDSTAQGGNK